MRLAIIAFFALCTVVQAQTFTKQDTLRGSITPERAWWKLTSYDLDIKVDPEERIIAGKNIISYTVLTAYNVMQIDLQSPMKLTKAMQNGKELEMVHDGNAHFITLRDAQKVGALNEISVYYSGKPRPAKNAPWDGGISWKKDKNGKHFIASSCQGLGASVWWPNKDHMYQEASNMHMRVNVPSDLMNISNGRLVKTEPLSDGTTTYHWFVNNPINNYGVNINIGDYVYFGEQYAGEKGVLDMDYYVLRDDLEKAKEHFTDAPKMMKAFEHWFGPYPFYEDSFKLVQVPYLGMEHQSSVTYGNQFKKGYLGNDLSGTGWGLKFDFIIIHEAGHEWFANNVTYKDAADMWIHEGFTAYSENLFIDYYYGKEASAAYVIGTRSNIQNDKPIIGTYDVNKQGSGDMYYKGANLLHTLRQIINDDDKWRSILRGLNADFYHQTVTTKQIEEYISLNAKIDLSAVFNQYLRDVRIPVLEYKVVGKKLTYKWNNVVADFKMPVRLFVDGKELWLIPTTTAQEVTLKSDKAAVETDVQFYVGYKKG
jgi:aminopeptidase N